jgi:hypothetical protein
MFSFSCSDNQTKELMEPAVVDEEESETGGLAWSVVFQYWHAVGGFTALAIAVSLLLMQV